MSVERAARLQRLVRQQRGRHQVAHVLARTGATLGHPLTAANVLDLAASDALREDLAVALAQVQAGAWSAFQHDWAARDPAANAAWWNQAAAQLPPVDAWLLPQEVATVGAIRVPAAMAWAAAPELAVENDDLFLVADRARAGLRLLYEADYAKYGYAGPWHLAVWGADWVRAAERAGA